MKATNLLKRFKKVTAFSLATVIAMTSTPFHVSVKAAQEDDYPNEIRFPMTILDFRQDNLLFEYAASNYDLTLMYINGGKGLVKDQLVNGKPEYKQEVVEQIARYVNQVLVNSSAEN